MCGFAALVDTSLASLGTHCLRVAAGLGKVLGYSLVVDHQRIAKVLVSQVLISVHALLVFTACAKPSAVI
jgi:hypothetical protein